MFAEDSGSSRWVLGEASKRAWWLGGRPRPPDGRRPRGPRFAARGTKERLPVGRSAHPRRGAGRHRRRARTPLRAGLHGLVAGTASGHEAEAGEAEAPPLADPWRITEEGRALVEPEAGVASAPYDREVGGEEEEE